MPAKGVQIEDADLQAAVDALTANKPEYQRLEWVPCPICATPPRRPPPSPSRRLPVPPAPAPAPAGSPLSA